MSSPTIKFIKSPSVNVTNGSKIVTLTGSVDTYHVYSGTVIFIGNNPPVEAVSGTVVDGSGNSTITLADPWSLASVTNEPLVAFNSNEGLPEAIRRARSIGDLTLGLMNSFEILLNSTDPIVSIDINGVPTDFVPYKYLENKFEESITSAEVNSAISKPEFERARLNELNRFSVAGTVNTDFDSSFEFHQINGWQNKFRIKANKTRIDGVWHDYSNTDITLTAAPNGLQNKDLVSADFVDLDAAIVAGGTSLSQSYLNQRHFVYMVQEDIAAPNGLSTAYIQDAKNNIYSDDGVLRQRVFSFVAERLLESVETHKSKRWTNTVNCMQSLGWTLSADVLGQWEKDGKKAVGITIVQSRNQGAYHPSFNTEGCGKFISSSGSSSANWYYSPLINSPSSMTDCFIMPTSAYPYSDGYQYTSTSVGRSGNLKSTSLAGRSGGEFFDAIYPSDATDNRMSVIDLPKKEVRERNNRKAISGDIRGFESVPFTIFPTITDVSNPSNTYFSVPSDVALRLEVGVRVWIETSSGYVERKILAVNIVDFQVDEGVDRVNGNLMVIPLSQIHKQTNPTWTDIIGSPENIAATFPDGVEGQWIPDFTSSRQLLNRKAVTNVSKTHTDNNGDTWTNTGSVDLDVTTNTVGIYQNTNSYDLLQLVHYETQAHFTQDDVNSEVLDLGGVFATGWNSIAYGNLLLSTLIGKIGTWGIGNPKGVQWNAPLTDNGVISRGGFDTAEYGYPKHATVGISSRGATVKTLDYLSVDNGITKICYAYKEMIYDTVWGDNNKFEITDNQSTMTDDNGNSVLYGTASFETEYFIIED